MCEFAWVRVRKRKKDSVFYEFIRVCVYACLYWQT